jgi:hypothetical protein
MVSQFHPAHRPIRLKRRSGRVQGPSQKSSKTRARSEIPITTQLLTAGSFFGDFRTPSGVRNSLRKLPRSSAVSDATAGRRRTGREGLGGRFFGGPSRARPRRYGDTPKTGIAGGLRGALLGGLVGTVYRPCPNLVKGRDRDIGG